MKRRERGEEKSLTAANNLKNSRNDVRLCVYIFVCVHTVLYACVCVCVRGVGTFLGAAWGHNSLRNSTKTWAEWWQNGSAHDSSLPQSKYRNTDDDDNDGDEGGVAFDAAHAARRQHSNKEDPPLKKMNSMTDLIYSWHVVTFPC